MSKEQKVEAAVEQDRDYARAEREVSRTFDPGSFETRLSALEKAMAANKNSLTIVRLDTTMERLKVAEDAIRDQQLVIRELRAKVEKPRVGVDEGQ
jgi:hypothetical protein